MSRQSRLLWRCRRGIKEMDLLLEAFVARIYPALTGQEQQQFENFLEETDLDILAWIMNRAEPDNPDYKKFVEHLQQINTNDPSVDTLRDNV